MKPELQQIAIAEACGWSYLISGVDTGPDKCWFGSPQRLREYGDKFVSLDYRHKWNGRQILGGPDKLPNYLGDLNAMHDAENILSSHQWTAYRTWLHTVCGCVPDEDEGYFVQAGNVEMLINATAAQRAEAFLRTIGKWQD